MELISWGFYEDVGDLRNEAGGNKYVIREVEALNEGPGSAPLERG